MRHAITHMHKQPDIHPTPLQNVLEDSLLHEWNNGTVVSSTVSSHLWDQRLSLHQGTCQVTSPSDIIIVGVCKSQNNTRLYDM